MKQTEHRVVLKNGEVLTIIEDEDALSFKSGDKPIFSVRSKTSDTVRELLEPKVKTLKVNEFVKSDETIEGRNIYIFKTNRDLFVVACFKTAILGYNFTSNFAISVNAVVHRDSAEDVIEAFCEHYMLDKWKIPSNDKDVERCCRLKVNGLRYERCFT